mmetsp:Transcript_25599/g.84269  ORF Transcript_25599/g.84269 Transcript_25599/m.84269 type:complete len:287 (-) Transcript_25599:314-1174(-)
MRLRRERPRRHPAHHRVCGLLDVRPNRINLVRRERNYVRVPPAQLPERFDDVHGLRRGSRLGRGLDEDDALFEHLLLRRERNRLVRESARERLEALLLDRDAVAVHLAEDVPAVLAKDEISGPQERERGEGAEPHVDPREDSEERIDEVRVVRRGLERGSRARAFRRGEGVDAGVGGGGRRLPRHVHGRAVHHEELELAVLDPREEALVDHGAPWPRQVRGALVQEGSERRLLRRVVLRLRHPHSGVERVRRPRVRRSLACAHHAEHSRAVRSAVLLEHALTAGRR